MTKRKTHFFADGEDLLEGADGGVMVVNQGDDDVKVDVDLIEYYQDKDQDHGGGDAGGMKEIEQVTYDMYGIKNIKYKRQRTTRDMTQTHGKSNRTLKSRST